MQASTDRKGIGRFPMNERGPEHPPENVCDADRVDELLRAASGRKVLVLGDVFLDHVVTGRMAGLSLEAPIPVFERGEESFTPGAAGNVARILAALGAETTLIGCVGDDPNGGILREVVSREDVNGRFITDPQHQTNSYMKLAAADAQYPAREVFRVDTPRPPFVRDAVESAVIQALRETADAEAIVVVDQISSMVSEEVLDAVRDHASGIGAVLVGDSRERLAWMRGFDLVVPNEREALEGAGMSWDGAPKHSERSVREAAKTLLMICRNALITRGPRGVTLVEQGGRIAHYGAAAPENEVVDVTGAGDAATASAVLALLAGGSLDEAAVLANAAGGLVVRTPGTYAPSAEDLRRAVCSGASSKLRKLDQLQDALDVLKRRGKRIVWTNGVFDLLHAGHVSYLQRASAEGDVLVVGINSDESVKRVKGADRPLVCAEERAQVLSALACVDYVTVFDDDNTCRMLDRLKPDVYVKGGDYTVETIQQDERRLVEQYGGQISIVPGVEGRSTTGLIQRMKK
jgi:D-beta-D-heptose 7-phosphate kinase/D-beta-D-heptose 1-phosphate adenosyltransferase